MSGPTPVTNWEKTLAATTRVRQYKDEYLQDVKQQCYAKPRLRSLAEFLEKECPVDICHVSIIELSTARPYIVSSIMSTLDLVSACEAIQEANRDVTRLFFIEDISPEVVGIVAHFLKPSPEFFESYIRRGSAYPRRYAHAGYDPSMMFEDSVLARRGLQDVSEALGSLDGWIYPQLFDLPSELRAQNHCSIPFRLLGQKWPRSLTQRVLEEHQKDWHIARGQYIYHMEFLRTPVPGEGERNDCTPDNPLYFISSLEQRLSISITDDAAISWTGILLLDGLETFKAHRFQPLSNRSLPLRSTFPHNLYQEYHSSIFHTQLFVTLAESIQDRLRQPANRGPEMLENPGILIHTCVHVINQYWRDVIETQEKFLNIQTDIRMRDGSFRKTGNFELARRDWYSLYLRHNVEYLRASIAIVRQKNRSKTPRAKGPLVEESTRDVLGDLQYLLSKSEEQHTRVRGKASAITATMAIEESRKAVQQANDVKALTTLATVYIPLTFVASLLGMNVSPLTGNGVALWTYFVFAFPISIVSLVLVRHWTAVRRFFDILGTTFRTEEDNRAETRSSVHWSYFWSQNWQRVGSLVKTGSWRRGV